ncbi:MAG: hypothetical protein A4E28_03193 [Methanocella sp. PtaU1.Bin125]|nr:MAG: hypothetical protein A4E28_03193 [Methanocella sp. PtaU1.Bin125]
MRKGDVGGISMRKIFCILAILLLFVPAAALAQRTEATTSEQADTGALPDSVLYIVSEVTDRLALAYATHDYDGIEGYMLIKEQELLQTIGATDRNDVKVRAHVNLEEQTAGARVMIRPDCLDRKLMASVNIHLNDEGQRQIDMKIRGDLTETQQAYVQALVEKIKYQMPGTVIKVKYL